MKPTSKKDWYIVLCENSNETTIVKNKTCNSNKETWYDYKYVVKSKEHFPYEMLWNAIPDSADNLPVISFEEWQSLPDEPNNVYSNSEFNSESKIIGYKLIKQEYKEAVREILRAKNILHLEWFLDYFDDNLKDYGWHFEQYDTQPSICKTIEEAGVMHWFEPVYNESITLKSGKVLIASEIEEVKEILKKL